jgi:hypothetical protein
VPYSFCPERAALTSFTDIQTLCHELFHSGSSI